MTFRSVVLGLLAAAAISGTCFLFDHVLTTPTGASPLAPHQVPTVVYGGLIVLLMTLNPLLGLARPAWRLTAGELAAVVAMALVACSIPTWGFCQALLPQAVAPHAQARDGLTGEGRVLASLPPQLVADAGAGRDRLLADYSARGGAVPWAAWRRTLGFWTPLALSFLAASLGLALVLHFQWSTREHLTYPISLFARSLLPEPGRAAGGVFRQWPFWTATLAVAAIVLVNFLGARWSGLVTVPLKVELAPFRKLFPVLVSGGEYILFSPSILFLVVGLMYLLPSSVSFSVAAAPFIFCTLSGVLLTRGISLDEGGHLTTNLRSFAYAGGYFGILLLILYAGRRYYAAVLARSVGLRAGGGAAEPGGVWGMRLFLVAGALFVLQLCLVGLPWWMALGFSAFGAMILIVVSRVVAETGAFMIGTELLPGTILAGFVGTAFVGPRALALMGMVSVVLLIAPGWAAMPFAVQGLKLSELAGNRPGRTAGLLLPAVLLAVAVAVPATLFWNYTKGPALTSAWPSWASTFPLRHAAGVQQEMDRQGVAPGEARLRPDGRRVAVFGIAAAAAVGLGVCNLRIPRWPLHPVMLVFLSGQHAQHMWLSCLIGWFAKGAALRFGGRPYYDRLKPAMIGLVAGDLLGQLLVLVVAAAWYFATGTRLS